VKSKNVLAGIAVTAVAIIAAIVSFNHIDALALTHGYSYFTAALLPFSVDGLIVAASLSLMAGIRSGLSRFGIGLGVSATLAANVAYGAHFGVVGALVGAWPAVAFVIAAEILVGMLRARPASLAETVPVSVPERVLQTVPETVLEAQVPTVPEPAKVTVPESMQSLPVQRATRRASASKSKSPEHVFSAELSEGRLPSLRTIKTRMSCGNDRARAILTELESIGQGVLVNA
jgi:hypothetical protein